MSSYPQAEVLVKQTQDWFIANGGTVHSAVEIALSNDYGGYCLRVREGHDLPAANVVVSCPQKLVLSVLNVDNAAVPWSTKLKAHWLHSPEVLTRLLLVEQSLLQEQSFWRPYIQLLPQPREESLDTPLFYSEEDMTWIRGTNLEATKITREKQWRHEYDESMDIMSTCDKDRHEQLCNKWELYLWAATILTSRCFSSSAFAMTRHGSSSDESQDAYRTAHTRFPLLIPVFDIANHNPAANVSWEWHGSCCSFTTQSDLKAGDEVCISYDQKGNEELILGYGFSMFKNPADAFRLLLRNINASERLPRLNAPHKATSPEETQPKSDISIVSSTTVSSPQVFTLKPAKIKTPFFIVNPALIEKFSVLTANKRELNQIYTNKDGVSSLFHGSQVTHNQAKVASSLIIELKRKYSGITKFDIELPPWPKTNRQFHAARYRRSQLHILKSNIDSLRALLRGVNSAMTHLVRLEEILAPSVTSAPNEIRAGIYQVLRTRNAERIRESGHAELVFTLWISSCYLKDPEDEDDSPLGSVLNGPHGWLEFLKETYGSPPMQEGVQWRLPEYLLQDGLDLDYDEEEEQAIATSYLNVVKTITEELPGSIFVDDRWNTGLLTWALRIVQEEGLVCPPLEPQSKSQLGGEFVIFISKKLDVVGV